MKFLVLNTKSRPVGKTMFYSICIQLLRCKEVGNLDLTWGWKGFSQVKSRDRKAFEHVYSWMIMMRNPSIQPSQKNSENSWEAGGKTENLAD